MPLFGNQPREPQTVEVLGRPFACPICQHDRFYQGKAQLNTRVASLFNLDWANRRATYITCAECRHMTWFNQD